MKEAIKGNAPPFAPREWSRICKQILSARLEIGGKIGGFAMKKRVPRPIPHPEVLDELLDLDPEIDAFGYCHCSRPRLFLQMSGLIPFILLEFNDPGVLSFVEAYSRRIPFCEISGYISISFCSSPTCVYPCFLLGLFKLLLYSFYQL